MVPFCDRCTKLATAIIPHRDGEERYCEYHWQARMESLVHEAIKMDRRRNTDDLRLFKPVV